MTERAALAYLTAGLSVLPIAPGTKRPLAGWKVYQSRRPTTAEVARWYRSRPRAGVAIVCGAVSGLVVVDFDPRNGDGTALEKLLPATPTVESGGGGRHHYFRLPAAFKAKKIPALMPGVDLQAEGGIVIAPPSIHPNGRPYRWTSGLALGAVELPPLPAVVRDLIALHRRRAAEACKRTALAPAQPGALTLEAVLSRLAGVRRSGGQWLALCPGHDDHEQSLSVATGADGRLLLHCFAGCRFTEILDALSATVPA